MKIRIINVEMQRIYLNNIYQNWIFRRMSKSGRIVQAHTCEPFTKMNFKMLNAFKWSISRWKWELETYWNSLEYQSYLLIFFVFAFDLDHLFGFCMFRWVCVLSTKYFTKYSKQNADNITPSPQWHVFWIITFHSFGFSYLE